MRARALVVVVGWLGAGGVLAACDGADAVTIGAVERGRELFASPALSGSDFNVFACATCHGTTPDDAPPIAVSLAGTSERQAWWGGAMRSLYDAVDFCYVYFMRGFPSLDPQGDDGRALYEYLGSLATGQGAGALPPLPLTVVETVVEVGRGDATIGKELYDRSCAPCHGAPHTGAGRLGELVSIVPEASREYAATYGFDPRLVVIEKVRHGQFFGVGGNMPFYPLEIMDDEALADLLEYLDP
ncbi:MAG: c-type cytochrome [Deltaproteobacteria bacterium]|nr:c-type cytochrome [Deltaproteobacteria bacterium]